MYIFFFRGWVGRCYYVYGYMYWVCNYMYVCVCIYVRTLYIYRKQNGVFSVSSVFSLPKRASKHDTITYTSVFPSNKTDTFTNPKNKPTRPGVSVIYKTGVTFQYRTCLIPGVKLKHHTPDSTQFWLFWQTKLHGQLQMDAVTPTNLNWCLSNTTQHSMISINKHAK